MATFQMRCAKPSQSRVTRVKAVSNDRAAKGALVGASVAALMTLAPAYAGVQLEQPKLKNAFVNEDVPAAPQEKKGLPDPTSKAKKAPAEKASSQPEEAGEVDGLSVQALWPLGVIAAGGGLFALGKIDSGTASLFDNAVKDSISEGIGYEDKLKVGSGYMAPYYDMDQASRMAMGTKAIKAKVGKK